MKNDKKLGIWMDHSSANVMEFNSDSIESMGSESKDVHGEKDHHISSSENQAHNREQNQQHEFYKRLAATILNYNDILLFGPTDAKQELYNSLKDDHNYKDINFQVLSADKMTEHQQQAFVKKHFSKS